MIYRINMITRANEKFSGYNKPKKTPGHPKKSHAVLAKEGEKVKLIRFGQQGVKVPVKTLSLNLKKQEKRHLKQDTLKTLPKAKCPQLTGQIKLSGKIFFQSRTCFTP